MNCCEMVEGYRIGQRWGPGCCEVAQFEIKQHFTDSRETLLRDQTGLEPNAAMLTLSHSPTDAHTYTHTHTHTEKHTCTHLHAHTCLYKQTHTCVHTYTHKPARTHTHAYTQTHMRTPARTHIKIHTHTCLHTHTHTHTAHINAPVLWSLCHPQVIIHYAKLLLSSERQKTNYLLFYVCFSPGSLLSHPFGLSTASGMYIWSPYFIAFINVRLLPEPSN